jgi:hypothetical protein
MPLKLSAYGPPGSGKTLTALLFAEGLATWRKKRVAYVDTELGTKTYRRKNPARHVHPETFDFDAINTRSLSDILEAVKALDPKEHGVIVVDSISHVWDAAREAWESKNPGAKDIPLRAWGDIKRPYKELMRFLIQAPFDVLICGRQKNIFEEQDGRLTNVGVGLRAEGETQYEPDVCLRFEMVGRRGDEEGVVTIFCEKDRYSILSGRTYSNPTFKVIETLLPFLGDEAPTIDDEDERAAKDGDLLDDAAQKSRERESKSETHFREIQAEIAVALTLESLGAARAKANKAKRSMSEDHINALRLLFETRTAELNKATVGVF